MGEDTRSAPSLAASAIWRVAEMYRSSSMTSMGSSSSGGVRFEDEGGGGIALAGQQNMPGGVQTTLVPAKEKRSLAARGDVGAVPVWDGRRGRWPGSVFLHADTVAARCFVAPASSETPVGIISRGLAVHRKTVEEHLPLDPPPQGR